MYGFKLLFLFHGLFMLAFLLGLLFFVAWAIKNLKKDDLMKLAVGLTAVGLLGCIVTMAFGSYGWKDGKGNFERPHYGNYLNEGDCPNK